MQKEKKYTRQTYELFRKKAQNTNLECDEADDNACEEENEGDEEPDDTPYFLQNVSIAK